MGEKEAEVLWRTARNYGMRRGLQIESAEDFAQVCLMDFIGGRRKVPFSFLYADYTRRELGDDRTKSHKEKRAVTRPLQLGSKAERVRAAEKKSDIFETFAEHLSREDRMLLYCYARVGLNLVDIGEMFGVSEGRACQLIQALQKKLVTIKENRQMTGVE